MTAAGGRGAGLILLLVAAALAGGALLLRRDAEPPAVAPRLEAQPLRAVAADSGNTPPALLSLLDPSAANPADDRARWPLPDPAPPPAPAAPATPPPDSMSAPPRGGLADTLALAPTDDMASSAAGAAAELPAPPSPEVEAHPAPLEPPVVLRAAWFAYPEEARRRRSEGNVEVRILVDTAGGVAAVELEEGAADTTLNAAALAAARTMRFRPARRGDQPVTVWFNYRFSFALPS
jgi:protein TonB